MDDGLSVFGLDRSLTGWLAKLIYYKSHLVRSLARSDRLGQPFE